MLALVQAQVAVQAVALIEADAAQDLDRRHVPRVRERLAREQRAEEVAVGVADAVRASLQIVDRPHRVDETALQRLRVKEGLEGRARAARRTGEVHRAREALVEVVGGAHRRAHGSGVELDHHERRVAGTSGLPRADLFPQPGLEFGLQLQVEGGEDARVLGVAVTLVGGPQSLLEAHHRV
ncbi:MAG: hypothetical protein EP330_13040 [Deltaproteobacteria bacterium]|nr:MAG: hypothetical protein EP330_13040 [Deltaproteobacteria bacterium]